MTGRERVGRKVLMEQEDREGTTRWHEEERFINRCATVKGM
jgi:hypothetical protein